MHHPEHNNAKRVANTLQAAFLETVSTLHDAVSRAKGQTTEVSNFMVAGNMLQASAELAGLYTDLDRIQKVLAKVSGELGHG